jgi:hypothetical protein
MREALTALMDMVFTDGDSSRPYSNGEIFGFYGFIVFVFLFLFVATS